MPELPEVEVTKQGVSPHLVDQTVRDLVIRNASLRWPVPDICKNIIGQTIKQVRRRAKYLLIDTDAGITIVHLGMSGSLRILPANTPVEKHDHIDLVLENGRVLRYNDPRRLGLGFGMNCQKMDTRYCQSWGLSLLVTALIHNSYNRN